jgi:hypothetical protein
MRKKEHEFQRKRDKIGKKEREIEITRKRVR